MHFIFVQLPVLFKENTKKKNLNYLFAFALFNLLRASSLRFKA